MQKIQLWKKEAKTSITPYLIQDGKPHAALLVIPGGGYGFVCEGTEGSPIAKAFNKLGYHTFVLDYRIAPHRFPEPQMDAFRAMKIIRGNAEKWNVIPDQIAAVGFSAGGHLAASLGTLADEIEANAGDKFDKIDPVPNAILLGYPVISLEAWSHCGTGKNLLGSKYKKNFKRYSLENRVTGKTPPVFLWHTIRDQVVNYHNSIVFAEALTKAGIPCELHLFPYGDHGMLLGLGTKDVVFWPREASAFLKTQWAARKDDYIKKRYTNSFQAEQEQKMR